MVGVEVRGLDKSVAAHVAEGVLEELKGKGFLQLSEMLDSKARYAIKGTDGKTYNVVCFSVPDSETSLRVVAAVDDGKLLSSINPLTRDFIIWDDGAVES